MPDGNALALPFTVASRPQSRYSQALTVSNLGGGGSFPVIQLPATGYVRSLDLFFTATYTTSASATVVAGDAPWNLVSAITLTDATGQPVQQPISGYSLYLVDKYLPAGGVAQDGAAQNPYASPQVGPAGQYAFSASGTSGSAVFCLRIEFEQDPKTGWGSIPNLDSNASLQLKIDYAASSVAFSGGTASAATLSVVVNQNYWATTAPMLSGQPVDNRPVGYGDYVETRYETQTVSASSENLVNFTSKGGLVKGMVLVSRAAGVRTAITAGSNFGLLLDNTPITEGIKIEHHYALVRRLTGYCGTDITTSYAALSAGTLPGIDVGVVPVPFYNLSGYRDSWLNTRVGSLFQTKITPGASATTLEVITQLAQVKDAAAFFGR